MIVVRGLKEYRNAVIKVAGAEGKRALIDANVKVAKTVMNAAAPGIAAESRSVASSGSVVRSSAGAKIRYTSVRSGGILYGAGHNRIRVGTRRGRYRGYNFFPVFRQSGRHVEPTADRLSESIAGQYAEDLSSFVDGFLPKG